MLEGVTRAAAGLPRRGAIITRCGCCGAEIKITARVVYRSCKCHLRLRCVLCSRPTCHCRCRVSIVEDAR